MSLTNRFIDQLTKIGALGNRRMRQNEVRIIHGKSGRDKQEVHIKEPGPETALSPTANALFEVIQPFEKTPDPQTGHTDDDSVVISGRRDSPRQGPG